jgi:hypothetical protein
MLLFEIAKFPLRLEAEKFVDTGLDASVRDSGDIVVVLLRVHRARSACPTKFHDRLTTTTVAIHKSNLARSIANSMSAAKRIERDVIRLIMHVQIQEIRRTQPEASQTSSSFPIVATRLPEPGKAEPAPSAR